MRLATVCAPGPDPRPLLAAYHRHLARTGRGNTAYWQAARSFFSRWPDPAAWAAEPLGVRLSANSSTRPLITFLMLHGHLRPGYDYLLERKISSLWRELGASPIGEDLARFRAAAPPASGPQPLSFADRLAGITPPIAEAMAAYLERKTATCKPKTVSSLATRLMHFGRFLTETDLGLPTLAALDRRRHIEPYLTSLVSAQNTKNDGVITVGERRGCRRSCRDTCPSTPTGGWPKPFAPHPTSWPPARCYSSARSTRSLTAPPQLPAWAM